MKLLRNGTSIERGTIDRQKRFDYSRGTVSALRNRTLYVHDSGLTTITRYLRPRKLYNRFPNENRRVLGSCATESLTKRRQTLEKSAASKSSVEIGSRLIIRGRSRGLAGCFSGRAGRKKEQNQRRTKYRVENDFTRCWILLSFLGSSRWRRFRGLW